MRADSLLRRLRTSVLAAGCSALYAVPMSPALGQGTSAPPPLHYLSIQATLQYRGETYTLDNVVGCVPGTTHASGSSGRYSFASIHLSRRWLTPKFKDGSVAFIVLPVHLCTMWPGARLPPEQAKQVPPELGLPPNFIPFVQWADNAESPSVIEHYVSRAAYKSAPLHISTFTVAALPNPAPRRAIAQSKEEDRTAVPHPGREVKGVRKWEGGSYELRGIPAVVWSQYETLAKVLQPYEKADAVVALNKEERATAIADILDAHRLVAGPTLPIEWGLPEADGRSGVLGRDRPGPKPRARATYAPGRCTTPRDFDLPVVCPEGWCRALFDRMGTRIVARATKGRSGPGMKEVAFGKSVIPFLLDGMPFVAFDPRTQTVFTQSTLTY